MPRKTRSKREEESNLVPFGDYSIEDAEEDKEKLDEDLSKDFIKIPEGSTRLRILPPKPGKKALKTIYIHYIDVPGFEGKPFVVVCPKRTPKEEKKRACPACKRAETLKATGDPRDVSAGYRLEAKRRVHCNVIRKTRILNEDGDPETVQKGEPKVWVFGPQIHNQLIALRRRREDPVDFVHPVKGFDLIVTREGTGPTDTKYTIQLPGSGKSRLAPTDDEINDLIDNQRDLSQYEKLASDDDILDALEGEMPERKRLTSGSSSSYKKRGKTVEDDDVVDGDIVDDDDY